MLWKLEGIKVFLDVSTYCNAGCPQCHRTNENGLGKQDWLPLIRWDLKTFQKAFPADEMKNVETFKFCGTWGDPVMCKELYEMCEYIINNSKAKISMDTNGSIRDAEWWWNLGVTCGKRLEVVFDVDGIDQSMHEKYRRFTSLEKVLENMETLSQTRASVFSQTVLFKHNQNYKEEITKLVKDHGSTRHSFVISDRFDSHDVIDNKRYFVDENGKEDYLEKADAESLPNAKVTGRKVASLEKEIICRWALPRNEVVINPDGQVMPCCYHANVHYKGRIDKQAGKGLHSNLIYKEDYNVNLKKYNVLHTPLSEIINSKWYQKTLPESMLGDSPVKQCETQCSSRIKKSHQLRSTNAT